MRHDNCFVQIHFRGLYFSLTESIRSDHRVTVCIVCALPCCWPGGSFGEIETFFHDNYTQGERGAGNPNLTLYLDTPRSAATTSFLRSRGATSCQQNRRSQARRTQNMYSSPPSVRLTIGSTALDSPSILLLQRRLRIFQLFHPYFLSLITLIILYAILATLHHAQ